MCAEFNTVVIDNGTGFTKMGYAGNFEPSYIIPSVIADSAEKQTVSTSKALYTEQLDFFIGQEALKKSKTHNISYPIRSGMVDNWELMEKYWHRSIYSYLRCQPEDHYFILTEPPMNTPENREQMAEIMFETFGVAGLYIGVQAVLALYAGVAANNQAQAIKPNQLTGAVIDSGDGVTHVIPVSDGFVIGSCIKHAPLAGHVMTTFIKKMLKDRGEKVMAEDLYPLAVQVKERDGYVCKDLVEEYAKYDAKIDANGVWKQSKKFKTMTTRGAVTGKEIKIDVGYERFLGPEMFFHPEFVSKEWKQPLDEVIDTCIQQSPIHCRIPLYNNIVLSGGSTLIKGFDKRLKREIQRRVDGRLKKYEEMSKVEAMKIKVGVQQNMVQRFAVWFGGSYLATSGNFPKVVHTREEYEEKGPAVARYNPVFPEGM